MKTVAVGIASSLVVAGFVGLAPTRAGLARCDALASERAPVRSSQSLVGSVFSLEGLPLAGAQVLIAGTSHGTLGREDGTFELGGLGSGLQIIEVRLLGHGTQWHQVDGSALGSAPYCFVLRVLPVRPVRRGPAGGE